MKQSRCTAVLCSAVLVFLLVSCGNGGNEKTATTDSTTVAPDTAVKEVPPPVNTIVTTPVTMAVIMHKVKNFDAWMAGYDSHDSARLAAGLHNYVIGRGLTDTNMVMIALRADDLAKAKAFAKDPGLKAAMQKAGVTGPPKISFTTATWQDTAAISTRLRAMTTGEAKDWDVWVKAFEEGRQERADNGISDRVIGHDADDNKKISMVTAISDTAKAFAYYKSDALKKRREASGMVGEPSRFLFNIVKRY